MNKLHNKNNTSCLVERMLYYIDLNDEDIRLLQELEKEQVSYRGTVQKISFWRSTE